MNKQIESSNWLSYAKEGLSSGTFRNKDIILEWKKSDIQSPDLAAFKREISNLACETLTPIEIQFLQKYPHAVSQELFLKPCAPFFEHGIDSVDWGKVEEKIQSTIKQFYLMDLSNFGAAVLKPLADDVYFFITMKEKDSKELLGFCLLSITPMLAPGNIKLINLVLTNATKERGIALPSSIFNILPQVKRIFTFARPTNTDALERYRSWGFRQDLDPIQDPNHKVTTEFLICLEYITEQSNVLQKAAEILVLY